MGLKFNWFSKIQDWWQQEPEVIKVTEGFQIRVTEFKDLTPNQKRSIAEARKYLDNFNSEYGAYILDLVEETVD